MKNDPIIKEIETQIAVTRISIDPEAYVVDGLREITTLVEMFFNYAEELFNRNKLMKQIEDTMDKKIHKITESMKLAEKDIKKGAPKAATSVLKGAEKKNEKLVKIDREVRDPIIKGALKAMKKPLKGSK